MLKLFAKKVEIEANKKEGESTDMEIQYIDVPSDRFYKYLTELGVFSRDDLGYLQGICDTLQKTDRMQKIIDKLTSIAVDKSGIFDCLNYMQIDEAKRYVAELNEELLDNG